MKEIKRDFYLNQLIKKEMWKILFIKKYFL